MTIELHWAALAAVAMISGLAGFAVCALMTIARINDPGTDKE